MEHDSGNDTAPPPEDAVELTEQTAVDPHAATETTATTEAPTMATKTTKAKRTRGTKRAKGNVLGYAKGARKSAAKKTKATKTASTPRARGPVAIPKAEDLVLEQVVVEPKNRYINMYFEGGFVARLYPANVTSEVGNKIRDVLVSWMAKKLKK